MRDFISVLKHSILFKNIDESELVSLFSQIPFNIVDYSRGDIVALEDDPLVSLGIVLKGALEAQKSNPTGKAITINTLVTSDFFGEALLFSDRDRYPASIYALNDSAVLYIKNKDVLNLCLKDERILLSFMRLLSNKLLMLNSKLKMLSYSSIRQKLAHYIIEEYHKQGKMITLHVNRQEMADILGVARPSLSREFIHLKELGLIDFYKNTIKVLDLASLKLLLE